MANLFDALTLAENKALFEKLGHAGTRLDAAMTLVEGEAELAPWWDRYLATWRECNALRSDLNDARFGIPRATFVPTGTGWPVK